MLNKFKYLVTNTLFKPNYASFCERIKAQTAQSNDKDTIFDKIIRKEIKANVIYEDDIALAFNDVTPQAPTHFLVIPKVKNGLTGLSAAEDKHKEILGHLLVVTAKVAKEQNLNQGYRLVINDGPHGCQSIYHLHIHVMGGGQLYWPPGTKPY